MQLIFCKKDILKWQKKRNQYTQSMAYWFMMISAQDITKQYIYTHSLELEFITFLLLQNCAPNKKYFY